MNFLLQVTTSAIEQGEGRFATPVYGRVRRFSFHPAGFAGFRLPHLNLTVSVTNVIA
jgi:hypothetical protein